jgi:outer membrane protein
LEAAELASRGVRREQQFGQRSMIDVLNQEQERLNARVSVAEAERDVIITERALAAATGMVAELLGVDDTPRRNRDVAAERTQHEPWASSADADDR